MLVEELLNLLGPLAFPECRRASRRGSLIWLRWVVGLLASLALVLVLLSGRVRVLFDPHHNLDDDVRTALELILGGIAALVLILVPALLAGTLAGEKERGSIALLLSTEATARDIVLGRWIGRLAPLGLVVAAAVPLVVPLLALGGYPASVWLTSALLPVALGLGSGGFALAVSAVSRRGRDALLLIALLDLAVLIASKFLPYPVLGWLVHGLDPFEALDPLVDDGVVGPSLTVAAGWLGVGVIGLAIAAGRLRLGCLADPARRLGSGRPPARWRVPPIGNRPMLWKELHIDRAGSLGRVGRWVGGAIALWLAVGSVGLALGVTLAPSRPVEAESWPTLNASWSRGALGHWYGETALAISFLIQASIGLRSAVMVASERERGTWDAILTSPLTPSEIVVGKLGGSWFALRWLIGSALIAWALTVFFGGMTPYRYALTLVETVVGGTLLAGLGLAMSLRTATATRAMAATIAGWLGLFVAAKLVAGLATVLGFFAVTYLFQPPGTAWIKSWFTVGSDWGSLGLLALGAVLIVADTFARFDRIAGRATGGVAAVALDRLIHGRPMAPVGWSTTQPGVAES